MKSILVKDGYHLQDLIGENLKLHGNNCDLNHLDVSQVKDMSSIFLHSQFNGNISKWNVSNVVNMNDMFRHSIFNGDISKWDVSRVIDMNYMFRGTEFTGDLTQWTPYKLEHKIYMFFHCPATPPYWSLATDTLAAIKLKELKDKLDEEMTHNQTCLNKIKI